MTTTSNNNVRGIKQWCDMTTTSNNNVQQQCSTTSRRFTIPALPRPAHAVVVHASRNSRSATLRPPYAEIDSTRPAHARTSATPVVCRSKSPRGGVAEEKQRNEGFIAFLAAQRTQSAAASPSPPTRRCSQAARATYSTYPICPSNRTFLTGRRCCRGPPCSPAGRPFR